MCVFVLVQVYTNDCFFQSFRKSDWIVTVKVKALGPLFIVKACEHNFGN